MELSVALIDLEKEIKKICLLTNLSYFARETMNGCSF